MSAHRLALRCTLPLLTVLAMASPAFAAGSAADQAAAEVLFTDARKLAAAGDFEHACPKFAESQRLDPGAGTLLNLGACYEKLNKLASAWGTFKEAEMTGRNAGDGTRQGEAARRAEALAPQLAKLSITVPPLARVPGFELRRDGSIVGEGQWGSALPVDVGERRIEASAPGHKTWSTVVRVEVNGATASVVIGPLEVLPVEPATGAPATTWSTQRTVGVVLGGVGLVGVVVGSIFAAKAANKNGDSLPHCLPADVMKCDATGVALRGEAFNAARVSTGTFIAGGILLAGGLVVFVTAPRSTSKGVEPSARIDLRPMVGYGSGGLSLQGVW